MLDVLLTIAFFELIPVENRGRVAWVMRCLSGSRVVSISPMHISDGEEMERGSNTDGTGGSHDEGRLGARGEGSERQRGMERCREAKRYRAMQIAEGYR